MNKPCKHPESVWSVDRIARLIVGSCNLILIVLTLTLSTYFLFVLMAINANLVFTSITDKCMFKNLLISMGAKEREQLLDHYHNSLILTENLSKKSIQTIKEA